MRYADELNQVLKLHGPAMQIHTRWILLLAISFLALFNSARLAAETQVDRMPRMHGLCVQVGASFATTSHVSQSKDLLIHVLDPERESIEKQLQRIQQSPTKASVIFEHWTHTWLPHAENLANFVLVENTTLIGREEIERVLVPGGVGLIRKGDTYLRVTKSLSGETDEWTHQWHDVDGGLTTDDERIGIPQGIQWLSGPLFAMAGRKSSTQTLVSSGGLNFYITQNVQENVGVAAEEMQQYLVARDAYNGLVRWQRKWTGPFVTGNGETNQRMVASNGRLYATDEDGFQCLDPKTGSTTSELELPIPPEKILVHDERVLVQVDSAIRAYDSELKEQIWTFAGKKLSGLVISEGRCFVLSSGRSRDGRFQHDIVCLRLDSGEIDWRTNSQPHVESPRVRINFVADDFVALQAHGSLHMFSSDDGQHLWSKQTDARPGKSYVDERYVGHFYRRGLVWMLAENSPREPDGQNVWLGLDPHTGEVERTLKTTGNWPRTDTPAKMGCQVLIASDRYIMIPRQATFVDFETGEKLSFKFTRGGCGLGFVPANGLVYSHPHACGCYSDALRGFMGMHSRSADELSKARSERATDQRLTSIFNPKLLANDVSQAGDWPIYRGNTTRGGHSTAELGKQVQLDWSIAISPYSESMSGHAWKLRTGNLITPPTIAEGTAFVAEVDNGRIHAIDIETGASQWSFTASGRIDSPPTLYRGLCLFGSHDGYVYGLEAKTGKLAWKFRAAPIERRIVAFGSVESAWPVAGSVLVQDDIAFVAAGRAPDADGGIEVHAIEPTTGRPIWSKRVEAGSFRGLVDYLIGGNDAVYLANQRFDSRTGSQTEAASNAQHLRGGKVGLLEASWTKHDLALRKEIQTWKSNGASGQLLAFAPDVTAAYNFEAKQVLVQGDENEHLPIPAPRQVTGMAITNERLVLAGGLDRSNAALGGFLQLVDLGTGDRTAEESLTAEAVFDGVALSNGRIFVSTQDGKLHCFSTK